MMTDQTSHLALDSKLAGIVIPNDGNCHLKDNVYVKATSMVRCMSCTGHGSQSMGIHNVAAMQASVFARSLLIVSGLWLGRFFPNTFSFQLVQCE